MIALMMEAVSTSETLVDIDLRTRQYIPEYSKLHSLINFPSVKGFELDATNIVSITMHNLPSLLSRLPY
jgi:hypothetical protein